MAETIAHGVVEIEVNDRDAIARLQAMRAQYAKTMADIDRMEADVEIGADDAEFQDAVANAKRRVRELDGMKADPKIKTDTAEFKKDMAEAQAMVKRLDGQKAVIEMEVHGDRAVAANIRKLEKANEARHDAAVKLANQEADLADRLFRRSLQQANQESKVRESLHRQRLRELSEDEKAAHAMEKQRQKDLYDSTVGVVKQKAEVLKLQQEYAKLTDRVENLRRKGRATLGREAKAKVELDTAAALAKMEVLKATLNQMGGHPPVHIKIDTVFSRRGAADAMRRMGDRLGNVLNTSTRIGPFTTSLKNVLAIGTALSPIILDVVGALSSLIGVAGSAALGVGALGAAVAGGGIPALLGMGLVIKDVVQEFKSVKAAQKAYDDAVLKHGKTSDQAAKKMKELRHVMGGVSEETANQVKSARGLGEAWDKATKPAHASVWKAIGNAIETGNTLMPQFARRTNESMGIAERATSKWMKALSSPEGMRSLDTLMGNFNKFAAPVVSGLGNIAGYLGRVATYASGALPGLGKTFENWSKRLFDSADGSKRFKDGIDRVIQSARDVGNLFLSAGRLAKAFFGAGVKDGQKMVKSLTGVFDRWTDFIKQNPEKMANFFKDAREGAEGLVQAFAPLVVGLVNIAQNMSPFLTAVLKGIGYVGMLVAKIFELTGTAGTLTALGIAMGGMFAVSRIAAFVAMLGRAVVLLGQAGRLAAAGNLAGAFGNVAQIGTKGGLRGAGRVGAEIADDVPLVVGRTGKAATGAAREVGVMRGAVQALIPAVAGLGTVAGGIATAGVLAVTAAAGYGVYKLLTMKSASDKLKESLKQNAAQSKNVVAASNNLSDATFATGAATKNYRDSVNSVVNLKKQLNKLEEDGGKHTDAYRSKLDELNQALTQRQSNEQQAAQLRQKMNQSEARASETLSNVTHARNAVTEAQKAYNNEVKKADDYQKRMGLSEPSPAAQDRIAAAKKRVGDAQRGLNTAMNANATVQRRAALDAINYQRGLQGLVQVAGAAGTQLAKLAQRAPKTAMKIGVKFEDPKDAGRVAASANRALKGGVKQRIVVDIVANSKTAEGAIKRLNQVRIAQKRVQIVEQGGSRALAMVERISGKRLTPKQAKIIESGGSAALAMFARIIGVKVPAKSAKVSAQDQASAVISGIIGLIAGVQGKTVTITTIHREISQGHVRAISGNAAGRSPRAGSELSLVGEGRGPELLANRRTGRIARVDEPTLTNLDNQTFVIPTEPRFRSRGREFFSQFAREMGIPGFKKGKVPRLGDKGKAQARKEARSIITRRARPVTYSTDNLKELKDVTAAQRTENNLRDQVQREAGILDDKEPTTFLQQIGTDPSGAPIYAIDQAAINNWSAALEAMAKRFDALVRAVQATATAVQRAINRIGDVGKAGGIEKVGGNSVIGRANANIKTLMRLMQHEQGIMNSSNKRVSKKEKDAAKERYGVYKGAINDQKDTRSAAYSDYKSMDEEKNAIGDATRGRMAEALDSAATYRSDAAAVAGKAAAEAVSAAPAANADPFADLELAGQGLSAQEALIGIGQGGITADQLLTGQTNLGQQYIDRAKAMLADADPSNDSAAYNAITTGAGLISSAGGSTAGSAAQQMISGSARQELYKTLGSNFALASNFGATSAASRGSGSFGTNPAAMGSGGGTVVENLNASFPVQPSDPHTFAKGLGWELAAL